MPARALPPAQTQPQTPRAKQTNQQKIKAKPEWKREPKHDSPPLKKRQAQEKKAGEVAKQAAAADVECQGSLIAQSVANNQLFPFAWLVFYSGWPPLGYCGCCVSVVLFLGIRCGSRRVDCGEDGTELESKNSARDYCCKRKVSKCPVGYSFREAHATNSQQFQRSPRH